MTCRVCQNGNMRQFLSLGDLPLGNAFTKSLDAPDRRFELALGFCSDCYVVQQVSAPPIDAIQEDYRDYRYVPVGVSLRKHLAALGEEAAELSGGHGFVVDLGSNDGCLLKGAREAGAKILGVEPAESISFRARAEGIPTITAFFDPALATEIKRGYGRADVITCVQTFQHVPDPIAFMEGVATLLKPDGILVIEGRYFLDTMERMTWDSIYHEMLTFSTLHGLTSILGRADFRAFRASRVPTHGGSIRVYASRERAAGDSVGRIMADETAARLDGIDAYDTFARSVSGLGRAIKDIVSQLRQNGARIVGYGAPSTSATLLGFAGVGADEVLCIADDSPLKQGRYHPGTKIPVVPPDAARALKPTHIFVLSYQFRQEIIARTKDWGAQYVIPNPPMVIDGKIRGA